MRECAQCTDYLEIIDFEGDHVCPICFKYAKNKRDAAVEILKKIYPTLTEKNAVMKSKIKAVLEMRTY